MFVCVTCTKALPLQIEGLYHSMFGCGVEEFILGISTAYTHTDNDPYDISIVIATTLVLSLLTSGQILSKVLCYEL